MFLKRLNKNDLVILEKKNPFISYIYQYFFRSILFLILFIVFCNGIIYYYNQLEKKYLECLVEKESFFFEIFPIKNCENRVSLFNVSDKYLIQFTIFFFKGFHWNNMRYLPFFRSGVWKNIKCVLFRIIEWNESFWLCNFVVIHLSNWRNNYNFNFSLYFLKE